MPVPGTRGCPYSSDYVVSVETKVTVVIRIILVYFANESHCLERLLLDGLCSGGVTTTTDCTQFNVNVE